MSYTALPYVFDLLYDIKTLEQLNDHLSGKQRQATSATDAELYALARDNNVDCTGVHRFTAPEPPPYYGMCDRHLKHPEGTLCPFCRASRMEAMLVRLTKPECGVMPDLVGEIKRALKETGYGHH
ncbi:hypothetical protein HOV23_gp081 [Pseudomonas phage Lana]|uniref:Uncharacterized protein n=1 Tax=Pseudomonas phage Lana TaxID=2530172 RepID=A0A481W7S5_9CAUD|nr:hypothetical protein HOV23_gp081 [Pseudomonas phage Lana]QBJ04492.1 hypothetical protein [Pseudomonas phage Lana]